MATDTGEGTQRSQAGLHRCRGGGEGVPLVQSRSYNYFTPRKRRATVYEDVTVDVQPDPARHLTQGWVYAFANGDAGYPQKWTALKSSNWHEFLDPNEEWEQTIYRNGAASSARSSRTSSTGGPRTSSPHGPRLGEGPRESTSSRGRTPSTASGCTSTRRRSATRRRT